VSHWLYAAPLLAERGMTGVFFAVTDFIRPGPVRGRAEAPRPMPASEAFRRALATGDCAAFMNESELAALVQDLGMEVYSHSAAHKGCFRSLRRTGSLSARAHWSVWGIYGEEHDGLPLFERGSAYAYNGYWPRFRAGAAPAFTFRSDADRYAFCLEDLQRSLHRISGINRAPRQLLCWPWGQFDRVALDACRNAGFSGAFTLERSPNGPGTDPFNLGRIRVGPTKTAQWLRARLAMHATAFGARVFSKQFRKAREAGRLLYVTDSARISGGNRQLLNNVQALSACGLAVMALAPPGTEMSGALSGSGARVIPWDHPRRLWRSARFLAEVARAERIDVVHAIHSRPAKAAVLAKLLGGGFALFLNRGVTYRPNPLVGVFALIADGVICNSRASARLLRTWLAPRRRVDVVYSSVAGGPGSGQPGEDGDGHCVVWVGNGNPVKGHDVFLRLADRYAGRYPKSRVRFISYGVEPDTRSRPGSGRDMASSVEMHGPVPQEAVLGALARADIFVLTSRRESLPNVLLEAFSCARPVVCTNAGGVGEVVRDGVNGWVVPIDDVEALASRVRDLVEHPERRREMGALNQRLAETCFSNTRKGYLLLRVYCGDHIVDEIRWHADGGRPTCLA
jgi:glycosyltransferase involved in cell wall biosynthesis/peptidoglycan/xylan/chitin deacetylase (PgdA/CDA1 family)